VFGVWLEQFPDDFDDPPKYTCLHKMFSFVTSEMKKDHGDDLAKKIKHRLDKFQITPFEDEGEMLYFVHVLLSIIASKVLQQVKLKRGCYVPGLVKF